MQFVQLAEFNRFVDSTIPLTWRKRWELIMPMLPITIVCGVTMAEIVALMTWLSDRNLLATLPVMALALITPTALLTGALELNLRLSHWTKRRLGLETNRIRITHAKYRNIPWKWIKGWLFEPLAERTDLAKVTVEYAIDRKGKRKRAWSIVLAQPEQTHALKSELDHLRERGILDAPIVELTEPATFQQKPFRFRGMVQLALALYFFVHGFPLVATGISQPEKDRQLSSDSTITEAQPRKPARYMARYFSSEKEVRQFFLVTGAALTGLGALFYIWGIATACKGRNPAQNNVTSKDDTL